MKKTNIALIIFSNGLGGAEQVVINLIKKFDDSKFNIYLITNDEMLIYFENIIDQQKIYSIGSLYVLVKNKRLNKIINKILNTFNMKKYILKFKVSSINKFLTDNNIKILHSHLMFDLFVTNLLKYKNNNIKTVYTLHGFLNLDEAIQIKYSISRTDFLKSITNMDYITSVSKLLENKLLEIIPSAKEKSKYLPNGIDENHIYHIKKSNNLVSKEYVKLLFMGGEKEVKGGILLFEAIKYLVVVLGITNFKLVVLGPINFKGQFYLNIKNDKILSKYIEVIGFIDPPKHLSYVYDADILVMPSLSEGMPIALLEAIALNTCVVASNIDVFQSLIEDERSGLLSEIDSVHFAIALKKLILNKQLCKQILINNKTYNIPYWKDVIKEYENIYFKLLQG